MDSIIRALVLTLLILGLVALSGMMGGMMGPDWMGTNGEWHGAMRWGVEGVTMLAFFAVVVVGVVLLDRVLDRNKNGPLSDGPVPDSPLEILNRRYASGDLTREQYEQMRRDLQGIG